MESPDKVNEPDEDQVEIHEPTQQPGEGPYPHNPDIPGPEEDNDEEDNE